MKDSLYRSKIIVQSDTCSQKDPLIEWKTLAQPHTYSLKDLAPEVKKPSTLRSIFTIVLKGSATVKCLIIIR